MKPQPPPKPSTLKSQVNEVDTETSKVAALDENLASR